MDDEQALSEIKQSLKAIQDTFMQMSLPELKRSYRYVGRASSFVLPRFEAATTEKRDILRPVYQTIIDLTINMSRRRDELQTTTK